MNNHRVTPKEWGLIKGALRRVFSRSELRKSILIKSIVNYTDATRPRVKKWSVCDLCDEYTPTYQMVVDHITPVVPINLKASEMSIQLLVDNIWCAESNLQNLCKSCHNDKTRGENAARRKYRKDNK